METDSIVFWRFSSLRRSSLNHSSSFHLPFFSASLILAERRRRLFRASYHTLYAGCAQLFLSHGHVVCMYVHKDLGVCSEDVQVARTRDGGIRVSLLEEVEREEKKSLYPCHVYKCHPF
jgi:hypothetical protein